MAALSAAFVKQKLCVEFAALKHAGPKGVYVAPSPNEPLTWTGVLFPRKGPYASAILRFRVDFSLEYPFLPPVITFLSDVFHPLVTPLTTYTHTARDTGSETVSAADEDKLPPGGFSLRHGFPEWYATGPDTTLGKPPLRQVDERGHSLTDSSASHNGPATHDVTNARPPHIVQVLQYLRVAFDTDAVIDSIPLNAAANSSAWHAWRSFRSKSSSGKASAVQQLGEGSDAHSERSPSPRQQPGGARRPAEWNWQGVWEDRVRKSTLASLSQQALYGSNDVINFVKMDPETLKQHLPSAAALSNA